MIVCFFCDKKLFGKHTQMRSRITLNYNVPDSGKIAQLMEDAFVVTITPVDYICTECSSFLAHMNKLDNDLKLVKNEMLSFIQKKHGILPPDQAVNDVETVNRSLKAEDELKQAQRKVPSGLTGVSPTVTTAAFDNPFQTPLKTQQQQQQQRPPPKQPKFKSYKCGYCTFHSRELANVRLHLLTHVSKKEPEKPITIQGLTKALTMVTQEEQHYRCQVCSKSFDSQINYLDHIKKDHNQPTPSTSNGEKETEDSCLDTIKVMKPVPYMIQENIQQVKSSMDIDKSQKDNNKYSVDPDMMLNDNVLTEESADVRKEEEEKNKEGTALPEQEEADQDTPDSIKEIDEDNANLENRMGDLDIE